MGRTLGKTHARRWAVAGLTFAISAACTPINHFHGYAPTPAEAASIQVGQSTRDSVLNQFGPPTTEGALTNNAIYYVSSQFRHFGALAPEEVDRQVVVIDFNDSGLVSNVSRYTLEDGRVVTLDRRVTQDGINDVTFLGQLLGSFGQIDAGTLIGEDEPI